VKTPATDSPSGPRAPVPVPLRSAIDFTALALSDPCDRSLVLGSFRPNRRRLYDSRIPKAFKECFPVADFQPHIGKLCGCYAELIVDALGAERVDCVCRVLGSAETAPDAARPLNLLCDTLALRLGAGHVTGFFFRSQPRPPMRGIDRLAGPDAIEARARFAADDLFVRPSRVGGTVALVDDIANTGASMRLYAAALKEFAGADRVIGVNLAATRFGSDRDGRGVLKLDLRPFGDHPELAETWMDETGIYHVDRECAATNGKIAVDLRFMCERRGRPCESCIRPSARRLSWLSRLASRFRGIHSRRHLTL